MAYEVQTVDAAEIGGGDESRLEAEGVFHFYVEDIKVGEMMYKDTAIEGFSVKLKVLEGEHKDKELGLTFYNDASTEKGTEMARKKINAFFVAANVLSLDKCKPGESVTIDEQSARSQQLIAEVRLGEEKNGKRYLGLHFANIYHVDDPRVAKVPKNVEALKVLDTVPGLRKPAAYFEPLLAKSRKPSGGGANGAAAGGQSTTAAAVDFDTSDL
jgi:hypothetical protein